MGQQWLKKNIKVEFPIGGKGKTLQEPCVTDIQGGTSPRRKRSGYYLSTQHYSEAATGGVR